MPNTSQDGPPDGYVTSADACTRLGISDRTLRRRVAAGTIEGEYLPRPQGTVLYVKLPEDAAMQTAAGSAARGSAATGWGASEAPQTIDAAIQTAAPPPAATEPPALTTSLLEMVKADRETIATLYAENADLRERVGRAEAAIEGTNARAEQYALDYAEQFERAVRAEAELQRLRGRRWYDPRTW